MEWLERTELLIGNEGINKLQNSNILIVGLGGVGSYSAEFLVRSGIGNLTIIDGDTIDSTNKNRQLIALDSTIGKKKSYVLGSRLFDINSSLNLTIIDEFLEPERMFEIITNDFDYVLDCIDSIQPKFNLIKACKRNNVEFISSMGSGGKIDASKVKVVDIWKTTNDKFAMRIRRLMKKNNIKRGFKVVFSEEPLHTHSLKLTSDSRYKKSFYGTISYIPAVFGLMMADYVIRKILS